MNLLQQQKQQEQREISTGKGEKKSAWMCEWVGWRCPRHPEQAVLATAWKDAAVGMKTRGKISWRKAMRRLLKGTGMGARPGDSTEQHHRQLPGKGS